MEVWIFFGGGGSQKARESVGAHGEQFFSEKFQLYTNLEQLDMGICESNQAEFLFWGGKGVG